MDKQALLMSVMGEELWGLGRWVESRDHRLDNGYWITGTTEAVATMVVGDRVAVVWETKVGLGVKDNELVVDLGDPDLIEKIRGEVVRRMGDGCD
jgi:hypothetical protein